MAAKDNLQGQQLAMFIPARVLRGMRPHKADIDMETEAWGDYNEPGTAGPGMRNKKRFMWQVKLDESSDDDLYESVATEGVHTPIELEHYGKNKTRIANGHHRIAAAYDSNPGMEIPVEHRVRKGWKA
jgi:ParB-like chromosome segregation protein Spo0J